MPEKKKEPRLPQDPRQDPIMRSIMRWLMEDDKRTLPLPEDDAGIKELARAIGKSPQFTRALMAWVYADQSDSDTLRILT